MEYPVDNLQSILKGLGPVALAFSGGVDSTFLLYECVLTGVDVVPVFVRSEFTRRDEPDFAGYMCDQMGLDMDIMDMSLVADPAIRSNREDRCYLCKTRMFTGIIARYEGRTVLDGTNASDDESDRPGMRALRELGIRSPLRDAGFTKDGIRACSKEAEIPTWDMGSNSCLATRVLRGYEITEPDLRKVESAEDSLVDMGFVGVRVRTDGTRATVQVRSSQLEEAVERFAEIESVVGAHYLEVSLDPRGRQ